MADDGDRTWSSSMPEIYDRYLGSAVFQPHAVDLARRAAALQPSRVIELAAGTGVLTRALVAALPGTSITATDLNPSMVEHGASQVGGVAWQQADAMTLPFDDGSADLVVCQFGVMFFPDRRAAFREVGRVLAPGGSFLFNTWDVLEQNDFEVAVVDGLARAMPEDPPTFFARIPHGYTDVAEIRADLEAAGLRVDDISTVRLAGQAASAGVLAIGYCHGTPARFAIEASDSLDRVTAVVTEEMTARLGSGPVQGRLSAHVVTAHR
ncbi:MAG: class I SAM-dependent methyltransferase [Candidatus Dormibacteria bacterium]